MQSIRIGDITGFDDAEVVEIETEEKDNDLKDDNAKN